MNTLLFETKQFRIQIAGKSAWVETSENAGWVLRSQHNLPVIDLSVASVRSGCPWLRAAVEDYERAHNNGQALRATLTGNSAKPKVDISWKATEHARSDSEPPRSAKVRQKLGGLRYRADGPLRPPLRQIETGQSQSA